jgi:sensor histidine kinase regulating citrate/malate metabolism
MADGAKLNQMEPGDIYALFGNAIDNAVTAVMALEDADKRAISIKILSQAQLVMIQIQNYYAGTLRFEDGLPQTQQTDHRLHGYGMKSMRYTAEKYHGTMTVQAKDQIFCLQVLIPQMIS